MSQPNPNQPPSKSNKIQQIMIRAVVPIVVAMVGGTGFWQYLQSQNDSQDCQIKTDDISLSKTIIEVNQTLTVSIRADNPDGKPLLYNWQAKIGKMNPDTRSASPQSTYTAPSNSVDDTISVDVTLPGCKPVRKSKQIAVTSPSSSTQTPLKTSTIVPSIRLFKLGSSSLTPMLIPEDAKINPTNGHKYFLTTSDIWTGVQNQAIAAGGNLVTISDAAEQKWLVNQFGKSESFWIGLHRNPVNKQQFEWVSGQPLTYTNWDAGVPDNAQIQPDGEVKFTGEDFVVMNSQPKGNGEWNDLCSCKGKLQDGRSVNYSSYRGIVEIEDKLKSEIKTDALFKEDFEGYLQTTNYCGVNESALTDGRTGRGLQVIYPLSKVGNLEKWGCRSFQLPEVFKSGKTYQASVWCKADKGTGCMLYFGNVKTEENKDQPEREGNGKWQKLTTRPIKMSHDEYMSVYVYSTVLGTSATYDDILVEEVVNK
jgi:hypothetical protein